MREVRIINAGVVTAAGPDLESTWKTLMKGYTAIRPLDRFPVEGYRAGIGAFIPALNPGGSSSIIRKLLDLLLDQVTPGVPESTLLITASTKAGIDNLEKIKKGQAAIPEDLLTASLGKQAANRLGIKRRPINISAACASSTVAVAQGASLIASGIEDSVLICCLDVLTEFVFSGFSALQVLSPFPCRPFDRERAGLSIGEGAAFILLMSAEKGKELGRPQLAVVAGSGLSNDARHITAPDRNGGGLIRAVKEALKSAGVEKEAVAGISAHGTGTVHNDLMELTAFRSVFGERCPPLYSGKGCLGHTFGAAGGIEIALGTKILAEQCLPPTVGLICPEQGAEGLVSSRSQNFRGQYLLTTNSGFGGINAAILLKRGQER
ncbi:MAG: beta-ketoacyl synthase N-terminal-like domain-containing protein [Thermodesulfobacteriota bacterium]